MEQLRLSVVGDLLATRFEARYSALVDPFAPRRFLDLSRYAPESQFLPIALLVCPEGDLRLVFLDLGPGESAIVWSLDDPAHYVGQARFSRRGLCQLLHAYGLRLDCGDIEPLLSTDAQREVLQAFLALQPGPDERLTSFDAPRPPDFSDFNSRGGSQMLLEGLRRNWTTDADALAQTILALGRPRRDTVLQHYEEMKTRCLPAGGDEFIERLVLSWKCSMLRELHYLHEGEHLAYSPFSRRYVTGLRSILVGDDERAFRLTLYEDERLDFIELSGQGFLSTVNAYLLPFDAFAFVSCYGLDNQSTWLRPGFRLSPELLSFAIDRLRTSVPDVQKERAVIFNDTSDPNLGHTLWNFFPGIFHALESSARFTPPVPLDVGLLEARLRGSAAFSSLSYSAMLRDLCAGLPDPPALQICRAEGPYLVDSVNRIVVLKALSISSELCEMYRAYLSAAPTEGLSLEEEMPCIFVNVRTHNKALLNMKECIERTARELIETGRLARFIFEGSSAASDEIEVLRQCCEQLGLHASVLIDADAFVLCSALQRATLVIAPVGSGLVIPTWVLTKHCLTFADFDHMSQLKWWNAVSTEPSRIDAFTLSEIQPVSRQFYASYRIDPGIFSERVRSAVAGGS